MIRLIKFLYVRRVLLVFLFFQTISFLFIRNSSPYYSAYYFSSSNRIAATILQTKTSIGNYFYLLEENEKLREANAQLKTKNLNKNSSFIYPRLSFKNDYFIQKAKVINNSIYYTKNYITLDVGKKEGVQPGMGVIGETGIIGFVKSASENYSTVTSLLHTSLSVSVNVGKERELASMNWDGEDYQYSKILHLPKHVKVAKGDSIFTSGYGNIFPEEILVAIVTEVVTEKDKSFHEIKVKLVNNFSSLKSAYVVIDKMKQEKTELLEEIE